MRKSCWSQDRRPGRTTSSAGCACLRNCSRRIFRRAWRLRPSGAYRGHRTSGERVIAMLRGQVHIDELPARDEIPLESLASAPPSAGTSGQSETGPLMSASARPMIAEVSTARNLLIQPTKHANRRSTPSKTATAWSPAYSPASCSASTATQSAATRASSGQSPNRPTPTTSRSWTPPTAGTKGPPTRTWGRLRAQRHWRGEDRRRYDARP